MSVRHGRPQAMLVLAFSIIIRNFDTQNFLFSAMLPIRLKPVGNNDFSYSIQLRYWSNTSMTCIPTSDC